MYKRLITIVLVFICHELVYAQQTKIQVPSKMIQVAGKIFFTTSHLQDTVTGAWMNETAILYYGQQGSLYRSFDYMTGDAIFKKWRAGGSVGPSPGMGRGTKDLYYTYPDEKLVQRVRDFIDASSATYMTTYVMPEAIERINWKILSETKKIDGYICQKATGICKGRNYVVWFCPDIPYSFGPWKLNGLPGLIMEAEDIRKQVLFRFSRIELQNNQEYITLPTNYVKTTEVDFEKMRQAYYDGLSTSNSGSLSVSATFRNSQGQVIPPPKRTVINNPMDLISKLPTLPF